MSTTTVNAATMYPESPLLSGLNYIQLDRLCPDPEKWYFLVPVIAAVALGSIYLPNVALGLAAGAAIAVVTNVSILALNALNVFESDNDSEYIRLVRKSPVLCALVVPVGEELIFRGALQPLMTRAIISFAPAAAATFLGTPLSIATGVSIVATAALFGLTHLFNAHKNTPAQTLFATITGTAFGVLAAQFGLGASIAAHVANNTLTITHSLIREEF